MKNGIYRAIIVVAFACVSACGGKVVIDQNEPGGVGTGGSGSSSSGSVDLCFWPEPVGGVALCGGTVGPSGECIEVYCDANQNYYSSVCQGSGCRCLYNEETVCTCAQDQGLDICAGQAAPCCPIP